MAVSKVDMATYRRGRPNSANGQIEGPEQSDPSFVSLAGVSRTFGTATALCELSLSVAEGEFVSILGPSGSGKSTTLNLLAGFDFPTKGSIHIGGRDVTWEPAHARDLGMVFQSYALFPHMTVKENIAFPLRARRWPRADIAPAVQRALDLVQLGALGERFPSELSGGQQQRVALARAVVYQPKVLLMDEPLGALDRKLRSDMQIEIKKLHRELGTTFLYVTHDQEEALSMSDRIAILRHGRLEQIGTPHEIYTRPRTKFVAGFIGDVSFLSGVVTSDGTGVRLRDVAGSVSFQGDSDAAPGSEVVVAFRPEHITLASSGSGTCAAIEEVLYLGNLVKAIARIADTRITATISANTQIPKPGDMVMVSLDAGSGVVFPKQSE